MTCSRCGIGGLHACPGAPIPPWTEEDKERLTAALGRMFNWEESAVKPNTIDVGPEVLPEITAYQVWCCSEGCGVCDTSSCVNSAYELWAKRAPG